jgi:hypothetical protein
LNFLHVISGLQIQYDCKENRSLFTFWMHSVISFWLWVILVSTFKQKGRDPHYLTKGLRNPWQKTTWEASIELSSENSIWHPFIIFMSTTSSGCMQYSVNWIRSELFMYWCYIIIEMLSFVFSKKAPCWTSYEIT